MKKNIYFMIFINLLFLLPFSLFADNRPVTIFEYHSQQNDDDPRFKYDYELFKLALEKTKEKYGPYEFKPLENKVNYKRVEKLSEYNKDRNLFFKHSVTNDKLKRFAYVPFPVDRGIVGYRIAFVSTEIKEKLKDIKSLDELKQYKFIQGLGWLDSKILKANGFNVIEGSSYSGMFFMVAKNRADIFLRGANELYLEWIINNKIENLDYDTSIVLYYPLPRFFFTNKENKENIKRVKEGLILAYNDGSLIKLWENNFRDSINFVELKKRNIFKLDNPFLEGIDKSYEKYIYTPE